MVKTGFLATVLVVVSTVVAGQPEPRDASLFVAGMQMQLGMQQNTVIGNLDTKYRLTKSGESTWMIFDKNGPPFELLGSVTFQQGKLVWISRHWGGFPSEPARQLGRELYRAVSSVQSNGAGPLVATAYESVNQPGLHAVDVAFRTGRRTLIVSTMESDDSKNDPQVSIQEIVEEPKQR